MLLPFVPPTLPVGVMILLLIDVLVSCPSPCPLNGCVPIATIRDEVAEDDAVHCCGDSDLMDSH